MTNANFLPDLHPPAPSRLWPFLYGLVLGALAMVALFAWTADLARVCP